MWCKDDPLRLGPKGVASIQTTLGAVGVGVAAAVLPAAMIAADLHGIVIGSVVLAEVREEVVDATELPRPPLAGGVTQETGRLVWNAHYEVCNPIRPNITTIRRIRN